MSPRVAILGSCVTRDIWSLPRFTIEDRRAVLALCRTSLASLFAEPCRGLAPPPRPLPHGISPWEVRMVGHDLGKTGPANLVAFQPTHLILDLIDERFDLLRCGEQVATLSWEAHLLGLLQGRGLRAQAGAEAAPADLDGQRSAAPGSAAAGGRS